MPEPVKEKRPYRSVKRQEQARATRASIVEAAHRLFAERGYGATTMEVIAAEANVAVQTVYATFGSKVEILKVAVDVAIAGDHEPLPLGERAEARDIAARPDQRERIRLFAHQITGIASRVAPLIEAVRSAAGGNPEAARLWAAIETSRLEGMAEVAGMIGAGGGLAMASEEARDTLWVLCSPALAVMLLTERGWSPDHYEAWLARAIERMLLQDDG